MIKIGIDATPLREQLTGVGNYLYYLLEELVQLRSNDAFYLYAIKESRSLDAFRKFSNVTIRVDRFLGLSEALWSQTTLPWLCKRDKIDLFWGTTQSTPLLFSKKSLLTIYDFAYLLYPKTVSYVRGAYLRMFAKKLYRKADCLITISKGTAHRLKALYGLDADRVVIPPLRNLEVESATEILKKHGLKSKEYYLMVGTLEPRKNLVAALRAYQGASPLVLVGAKGWRDSQIQEELQKKKGVVVLGYLPDKQLNGLIKEAKAFVMPSLYEGYGMPIAEARMLGTPVVCCAVPEMVEAAEGDALIVEHDQLERAFSTPLSSPKQPTYPSNEVLAASISEALSILLQPCRDCD